MKGVFNRFSWLISSEQTVQTGRIDDIDDQMIDILIESAEKMIEEIEERHCDRHAEMLETSTLASHWRTGYDDNLQGIDEAGIDEVGIDAKDGATSQSEQALDSINLFTDHGVSSASFVPVSAPKNSLFNASDVTVINTEQAEFLRATTQEAIQAGAIQAEVTQAETTQANIRPAEMNDDDNTHQAALYWLYRSI